MRWVSNRSSTETFAAFGAVVVEVTVVSSRAASIAAWSVGRIARSPERISEGKVDFDLLDAFTRRLDQELLPDRPEDVRFVYCIRVRGTNRVKIGFSKDPMQRLATLQTAHADLLDLELILRTRDYRTLERELHHKHRGRQIRGEWFAFAEGVNLLAEM